MCLNVRKKKYMYMSMCACCNVVSKHTCSVKNHLLRKHKEVYLKSRETLVIPIRIEKRHERKIKRKLDKIGFIRRLKNKDKIINLVRDNNSILPNASYNNSIFPHEIIGAKRYKSETNSSDTNKCTLICSVCSEEFNSHQKFLYHLPSHDNMHINVTFKCPECTAAFSFFKDIQDHCINEHNKADISVSYLDCTNVIVNSTSAITDQMQCPYCVSVLSGLDHLQTHVTETHSDQIQMICVKLEVDESEESVSTKSVLIVYGCRHCDHSFHTISDVIQHAEAKHPNMRSKNLGKSTRKRKPPKWLEDDVRYTSPKKCKRNDTEKTARSGELKHVKRKSETENDTYNTAELMKVKRKTVKQKETVELTKLDTDSTFEPKKVKRKSAKQKETVGIRENDTDDTAELKTDKRKSNKLKRNFRKTKRVDKHEKENQDRNGAKTDSTPSHDTKSKQNRGARNPSPIKQSKFKIDIKNKAQRKNKKQVVKSNADSLTENESDSNILNNEDENSIDNDIALVEYNDPADEVVSNSDDDYESRKDDNDSDNSVEKKCGVTENSCGYCNNNFTSPSILERHIRKQHKAEISLKKYKHAANESNFNDIESESKRKSRDNVNKNAANVALSNSTEKLVVKYKCPFCPFNLYHREFVISHVQQSHPQVKNFRTTDIVKEMVNISINDTDSESYKCRGCTFECKRKQTITDHSRTCKIGRHKNKNIECILPSAWIEQAERVVCIICSYCETVQQGKENFECHLNEHFPDRKFSVHLNNKMYEPEITKLKCKESECTMCPFCEFVATQKVNVLRHMKRFHSNELRTPMIQCVLTDQKSKEEVVLTVKELEDDRVNNVASDTCGKYENSVGRKMQPKSQRWETKCETGSENERSLFESIEYNDGAKEMSLHMQDLSQMKIPLSINIEDTEDCAKVEHKCETVYVESSLQGGTYICPLCDYKTQAKKTIIMHMSEHQAISEQETDALYILPDSFIEIEPNESREKALSNLKCILCDFSDVILTNVLRHLNECHKDMFVHMSGLSTDIVEPVYTMIKVTTENAAQYECKKYQCRACIPGNIFRSRKGFELHMKTSHRDRETSGVYDAMYKMLDLITDCSCDTRSMYLCSICDQRVSTKLDLIDHFHTRHPEKSGEIEPRIPSTTDGETIAEQIQCEVCLKHFTDLRSLKHHLILHVNRNKPTCSHCGKCFTNSAELERHNTDVHSTTGEMCYICGAMFPNISELERHIKSHETGIKKKCRILCQHCGTSILAQNMKKHLTDKHIELVSCCCDICMTQTVRKGSKSVTCDICNAIVCRKYTLKAHKHRVHSSILFKELAYKCSRCDVTFSNKRDQLMHSHTCRANRYVQDDILSATVAVGTSFSWHDANINEVISENIIVHNVGAGDDDTVDEDEEGDEFGSTEAVKQKLYDIDRSKQSPFLCRLCQKEFRTPKYVREHYRRMHVKDENKPFRCKICTKGFTGKSDFRQHCRTHIGLRQHHCNICKKSFKTVAHLKEHMDIHSSSTYRCYYCGLSFKQRGALYAHVVHHDKLKPFKCMFCEKEFTTNGDLQRHMNNYSKDSKGTKHSTFCHFCKTDYPNNNALMLHFKIHNPENPFSCSLCSRKFSNFRAMYRHKMDTNHFTTSEIEDGKMDLLTPGRKFRSQKTTPHKSDSQNEAGEPETVLGVLEYESPGGSIHNLIPNIFKDQKINEIEAGSSEDANNPKTKLALETFEHEVIKSMLEADPEVLNAINFKTSENTSQTNRQPNAVIDLGVQHDGYEFDASVPNNYQIKGNVLTKQEIYVASKHENYPVLDQPSRSMMIANNTENIAAFIAQNVQQNIPGETQTFETADGSIVHICVVKPSEK